MDLRADIYSLGCTLYHLVCGQPPFNGNSAVAIMMKHVSYPVPNLQIAWPECPQSLNTLVGKMMQKDPEDRPQDYETLINDLSNAYKAVSQQGGPTMAEPTPQSQAYPAATPAPLLKTAAIRKPASPQKSRLPIYVGLGVAALALMVGAFFFFKPKARFINSLGQEFVRVPGTKVFFCRTDVRVRDFRQYVGETGYRQSGGAIVLKVMKGIVRLDPNTRQQIGQPQNLLGFTLDPKASWSSPALSRVRTTRRVRIME